MYQIYGKDFLQTRPLYGQNKIFGKKLEKWGFVIYYWGMGILSKDIFGSVLKVLGYEDDYDVYYILTHEFNEESGEWDKEYYSYQVVIHNPVLIEVGHGVQKYLGLESDQVMITYYYDDSLDWVKM